MLINYVYGLENLLQLFVNNFEINRFCLARQQGPCIGSHQVPSTVLDNAITSTIGTCRPATSRYLPSFAEATMYAQGALSLEDVFPDGWTLRLGDRAKELTSGVATKREESPLRIRATQEEQYPKAVSEGHVDLLSKNH